MGRLRGRNRPIPILKSGVDPDFFKLHFAELVTLVALYRFYMVQVLGLPEGLDDRATGLQHFLKVSHNGAPLIRICNA